MAYKMKCLLCPDTAPEYQNLVRAQEHVMDEHGYTREQLQQQTRTDNEDGSYTFSMPDGKPWLQANRTGNFSSGV